MKKLLSIILALVLCLSALPAMANTVEGGGGGGGTGLNFSIHQNGGISRISANLAYVNFYSDVPSGTTTGTTEGNYYYVLSETKISPINTDVIANSDGKKSGTYSIGQNEEIALNNLKENTAYYLYVYADVVIDGDTVKSGVLAFNIPAIPDVTVACNCNVKCTSELIASNCAVCKENSANCNGTETGNIIYDLQIKSVRRTGATTAEIVFYDKNKAGIPYTGVIGGAEPYVNCSTTKEHWDSSAVCNKYIANGADNRINVGLLTEGQAKTVWIQVSMGTSSVVGEVISNVLQVEIPATPNVVTGCICQTKCIAVLQNGNCLVCTENYLACEGRTGYFLQTVTVNKKELKAIVANKQEAIEADSVFRCEVQDSDKVISKVDQTVKAQINGNRLLIIEMTFTNPDGTPVPMPLPNPVHVYLQIPEGWDKNNVEAILIKEGIDVHFEEEIINIDGVEYIALWTDHFSPYMIYEKGYEEPDEESKPCDHKLDENGKCSRCSIVIISYPEEKAETNPNTGAPEMGLAALIGAVSAAK